MFSLCKSIYRPHISMRYRRSSHTMSRNDQMITMCQPRQLCKNSTNFIISLNMNRPMKRYFHHSVNRLGPENEKVLGRLSPITDDYSHFLTTLADIESNHGEISLDIGLIHEVLLGSKMYNVSLSGYHKLEVAILNKLHPTNVMESPHQLISLFYSYLFYASNTTFQQRILQTMASHSGSITSIEYFQLVDYLSILSSQELLALPKQLHELIERSQLIDPQEDDLSLILPAMLRFCSKHKSNSNLCTIVNQCVEKCVRDNIRLSEKSLSCIGEFLCNYSISSSISKDNTFLSSISENLLQWVSLNSNSKFSFTSVNNLAKGSLMYAKDDRFLDMLHVMLENSTDKLLSSHSLVNLFLPLHSFTEVNTTRKNYINYIQSLLKSELAVKKTDKISLTGRDVSIICSAIQCLTSDSDSRRMLLKTLCIFLSLNCQIQSLNAMETVLICKSLLHIKGSQREEKAFLEFISRCMQNSSVESSLSGHQFGLIAQSIRSLKVESVERSKFLTFLMFRLNPDTVTVDSLSAGDELVSYLIYLNRPILRPSSETTQSAKSLSNIDIVNILSSILYLGNHTSLGIAYIGRILYYLESTPIHSYSFTPTEVTLITMSIQNIIKYNKQQLLPQITKLLKSFLSTLQENSQYESWLRGWNSSLVSQLLFSLHNFQGNEHHSDEYIKLIIQLLSDIPASVKFMNLSEAYDACYGLKSMLSYPYHSALLAELCKRLPSSLTELLNPTEISNSSTVVAASFSFPTPSQSIFISPSDLLLLLIENMKLINHANLTASTGTTKGSDTDVLLYIRRLTEYMVEYTSMTAGEDDDDSINTIIEFIYNLRNLSGTTPDEKSILQLVLHRIISQLTKNSNSINLGKNMLFRILDGIEGLSPYKSNISIYPNFYEKPYVVDNHIIRETTAVKGMKSIATNEEVQELYYILSRIISNNVLQESPKIDYFITSSTDVSRLLSSFYLLTGNYPSERAYITTCFTVITKLFPEANRSLVFWSNLTEQQIDAMLSEFHAIDNRLILSSREISHMMYGIQHLNLASYPEIANLMSTLIRISKSYYDSCEMEMSSGRDEANREYLNNSFSSNRLLQESEEDNRLLKLNRYSQDEYNTNLGNESVSSYQKPTKFQLSPSDFSLILFGVHGIKAATGCENLLLKSISSWLTLAKSMVASSQMITRFFNCIQSFSFHTSNVNERNQFISVCYQLIKSSSSHRPIELNYEQFLACCSTVRLLHHNLSNIELDLLSVLAAAIPYRKQSYTLNSHDIANVVHDIKDLYGYHPTEVRLITEIIKRMDIKSITIEEETNEEIIHFQKVQLSGDSMASICYDVQHFNLKANSFKQLLEVITRYINNSQSTFLNSDHVVMIVLGLKSQPQRHALELDYLDAVTRRIQSSAAYFTATSNPIKKYTSEQLQGISDNLSTLRFQYNEEIEFARSVSDHVRACGQSITVSIPANKAKIT